MRKITLLLILTTIIGLFPSPAKAAVILTPRGTDPNSVSTRQATPSSNTAVRQNQLASREANIKSQNKFVTGKITTVTDTTVMLTTETGRGIAIDTNQLTKFWDLTDVKKDITFSTLKIGDQVAVTGVAATDTTGVAKIIARIGEPVPHYTYWGIITDIVGNTVSIQTKTALISTQITNITKIKEAGFVSPAVTNLQPQQKVIVTGTKDSQGILSTTSVFVFSVLTGAPTEPTAMPLSNGNGSGTPLPTP